MAEIHAEPTKCLLCGHIFGSDLLHDAAVIGGNPHAKLQQVSAIMKPLMKHIQKAHPEAIQNSQQAGAEFAGWFLVAKCFEMDTPTAEKLGADFTRWNVHNLTRRQEACPSDERIRERAAEVWSSSDWTTRGTFDSDAIFEGMVKLLREMRDSIIEKDRYTQPASGNENGKRN